MQLSADQMKVMLIDHLEDNDPGRLKSLRQSKELPAFLETQTKAPVNGGAKLVHPGGAKLVRLTLCGTRCWGVVPVVHRRDPRCFE